MVVILFAYANFRITPQSKLRFVCQESHLFVTNEQSFPETRVEEHREEKKDRERRKKRRSNKTM